MRIKQLYSDFGIGFKEAAKEKFNLTDLYSNIEPALFIGCYNWSQLGILVNRQALTVIYWAGSDALALTKNYINSHGIEEMAKDMFWVKRMKELKNIKHISASHWIKEDLESLGIESYHIPISICKNEDIHPEVPGEAIYMYQAFNPNYNGGIYEKIKKRLPYFEYIETNVHTFKRPELLEAYKRSFIGLRFTEHDGLSETVASLGLMGRNVIHNGDLPNCINYDKKDIDLICSIIVNEHKNNDDYKDIAKCTFNYLDVGEEWLNTEYYE